MGNFHSDETYLWPASELYENRDGEDPPDDDYEDAVAASLPAAGHARREHPIADEDWDGDEQRRYPRLLALIAEQDPPAAGTLVDLWGNTEDLGPADPYGLRDIDWPDGVEPSGQAWMSDDPRVGGVSLRSARGSAATSSPSTRSSPSYAARSHISWVDDAGVTIHHCCLHVDDGTGGWASDLEHRRSRRVGHRTASSVTTRSLELAPTFERRSASTRRARLSVAESSKSSTIRLVPEQWTTFVAGAVAYVVDERLNVHYLAMAEHEGDSARLLMIQRALVDDEQDRELGQDTHCLVDEFQTAHYGSVTCWQLNDHVLELQLSGEASQIMRAGSGYRIVVPRADHVTVIRDALPSVMA